MKIVKGRQAAPVRAVIYGVEGIGKSTLAAQFPRPLFLDTEDGTGQLDVDRVACHDWAALRGAVAELGVEQHGYQTIVIDSIDWAERMLTEWVCKQAGKSSVEDFGFGKGWVIVAEHMARFVEGLDNLHRTGVHVVLVAHAKVQRTSPPDQTDGYDRYELRLSKQVAPIVKEWADALLFANYRMRLVEGTDGKKKAIGGKDRIVYAERAAAYDAKNRYGLGEELPMTIDALAPLFDGTAATPAAADTELFDQVRTYIADAKNVRTLGKIGNRIDELLSTDQLTSEQWSDLTDRVNARHDELEPKEVVDADAS
jgi:hypothetical protein